MHTVFIQMLGIENKAVELETFVKMIQEARIESSKIFLRKPSEFSLIDGAPFAYWVEERLIQNLNRFDKFDDEDAGRGTRCGLGTLDDFRFLRLRWEVDVNSLNYLWKSYLHGGIYSPIFDEFPLVTNWGKNGEEVKVFVETKVGSASRKVQGEDRYFQRGFVFSRRTRAFSPKVMPENSIFSTAGQSGFAPKDDLQWTLALMSSVVVGYIISLSQGAMAKGGGPSPQFEVGLIKRLAWPKPTNFQKISLADLFIEIYSCKRDIASYSEPSNWFAQPSLLNPGHTLVESFNFWTIKLNHSIEIVKLAKYKINELACQAYGLESGQWQNLLQDLIGEINERQIQDVAQADPFSDGLLDDSNLREINIQCDGLISFLVGCIYGRWNVEYRRNTDTIIDPFDPYRNCSPGMLHNEQGDLPAQVHEIRSDYPLSISWSGILVCDEGHIDDACERTREILSIIWKGHAETIEQEICQIMELHSLRDYFNRPSGFFTDHLRRYSMSRRQAPIYWPLSTPSNSYTLWLYYHRLNDQTLFTCVNDFVDPKIKQVSEEAKNLRQKKSRSSIEEKELERLTDFEHELKDFRDELLRVAKFWKPNLNDGVQITAAPLWKLIQHKPWQKKLRETWESLEAGEYDWAYLAYSIWPERVREKCKSDKSLAIAHDLEHFYVETKIPLKKKAASKKKSKAETEEMFNED